MIGERAVDRGEAAPDLDADRLVELLVGPLHFRALVTHQPVDDAYLASQAAQVAATAAATASSEHPPPGGARG